MLKPRLLLTASLLIPALFLAPILRADDTTPPATPPTVGGIAPRPLVDIPAAGSESKFVADEPASHGQVTISHSDSPAGVVVTIAPGEAGYPGVSLKPEGGTPWTFPRLAGSKRQSPTWGRKNCRSGSRRWRRLEGQQRHPGLPETRRNQHGQGCLRLFLRESGRFDQDVFRQPDSYLRRQGHDRSGKLPD